MCRLADADRVRDFLQQLARSASQPARVYLVGGATAVLEGWRATTIDIDLKLVPEADELLRAMPRLKEQLQINVELASPEQFIPEVSGWEDRSRFLTTIGKVSVYHLDPYSQALAKIERGHSRDLGDVYAMLERGLIEKPRLKELFERIEPELYRYPAIDPATFRRAVEQVLGE